MSNFKRKLEQDHGLDLPIDQASRKFGELTKADLGTVQNGQPVTEGEIVETLYQKFPVRRIFHDGEWWFSVIDVVAALTDSARAAKYWFDLKSHLIEKEGFSELSAKIGNLPLPGADGKHRHTDVVMTETLLRLIQSIPSPRAEPFKRWLAKVGYERIQETQNPEIAVKRAIVTYQLQGRSDDWIEKRIRSMVARKELTGEWKRRGVKEGVEFAVLTDKISKATFNVNTDEHKRTKGLDRQSLRDHMTDLELLLTMLGEKSTTEIARVRDAKGFTQNAQAAEAGGKVAGTAREQLEKETGQKVLSATNFIGKQGRADDPLKLSAKKGKGLFD